MIYLYAIADRAGMPLPDQRGLDDAALAEVAGHGLAAVYSRHDELRNEPTPGLLWTHEAVVEALMGDRAVLPMRFGTCLPGEDALVALLDERGVEFARVCERVRGRVELSVRVGGRRAAPRARPSNGAEYMMRRLGARRDAEQIAQLVHAPLAQLAERSTSRLAPERTSVLTGSYLLRHEGVDRFTGQVRRLQRMHPALALTCTGPWPPYSFVEVPQA